MGVVVGQDGVVGGEVGEALVGGEEEEVVVVVGADHLEYLDNMVHGNVFFIITKIFRIFSHSNYYCHDFYKNKLPGGVTVPVKGNF